MLNMKIWVKMCFFELNMCSIRSSIPDLVSKFQFFHILNSLRKINFHFFPIYPFYQQSRWQHFSSLSIIVMSTFSILSTFSKAIIFPFYPHFQFPIFFILSRFWISSFFLIEPHIEKLSWFDPGSEWFYNQKHVLQWHQSRKLSPAERGRVV